jgi:lysine 6-dehydrogenase
VAEACQLDVTDAPALASVIKGADVALSAVPYYFNLGIVKTCTREGVGMCDMGGNTEVVWAQLELDGEAKQAGVSLVPDCGMGPGLINTMGIYVMDLLDEPREVYLYDAGLSSHPTPPWNFVSTFHINGLTNEYNG